MRVSRQSSSVWTYGVNGGCGADVAGGGGCVAPFHIVRSLGSVLAQAICCVITSGLVATGGVGVAKLSVAMPGVIVGWCRCGAASSTCGAVVCGGASSCGDGTGPSTLRVLSGGAL